MEWFLLDNQVTNPFSETSQQIAILFDKATIEGNAEKILDLISKTEKLLQTENAASQATLYYSIATAYSDYYALCNTSRDEPIRKQLYAFRKSISLIESEQCNKEEYAPYVKEFKIRLYTNYANTLDRCGRTIAAIAQYKKVLGLNPDYGMALGNLGRTYMKYGDLEYDPGHRDYFHYHAYSLLDQATVSRDDATHDDARAYFESILYLYDVEYIDHLFDVLPNISDMEYENVDELAYREWALSNGLFLNTLNDLPEQKLRFAADVIQLPSMIVAVNAKPVFHGMFNQIKQEYIYARYMYYSSLQVPDKPHFADTETYLLNSSDYPQYSIRIEQLKSAYKTLYGLFDKVAFFINAYFDLGIHERDVSFSSIWLNEHGPKKQRYKNKNNLAPESNFALSSLYWISRDFTERFEDSPNPQLQRLKDLRHAMEHRYIKVVWSLFSGCATDAYDDLAVYVAEDELYDSTLELMRIVREVIVCLALSVNIEESDRKSKMDKSKKIMPMTIMGYDDQWKL